MKIYKLNADSDGKWVRFFARDSVVLPAYEESKAFFERRPRIGLVRNNEYVRNPATPRLADFTNVNYQPYACFSGRAKEALGPCLETLGQWLQLECDEAPYWLFNITNVLDALDEPASKVSYFDDRAVMDVKEFVFKPEAVRGQLIFKILQRPNSYNLVTDRFVELVRQHRLTGFKFHLLWSLDGGAVSSTLKAWERPTITGLEAVASG